MLTATSPEETSCVDLVFVVIAFSAYTLFAIVLFINLLIAMMNSRYNKEIDGATTAKWLLNRHAIMRRIRTEVVFGAPSDSPQHPGCIHPLDIDETSQ